MARLIDYSYVRQETDIAEMTDYKLLDNPIKWAMDQLNFLLGKSFYDELYGEVIGDTLTAANSAFFDPYVKQFLAWTAYHDYVIKSGMYNSRTGPRVWREENSDPASDGMMNMLVKKAAEKVQFYKGNMVNYLLNAQTADSSAFPLYKNCNDKMGTGFGISGITRIPQEQTKITKRTIQNGY